VLFGRGKIGRDLNIAMRRDKSESGPMTFRVGARPSCPLNWLMQKLEQPSRVRCGRSDLRSTAPDDRNRDSAAVTMPGMRQP